MDNIKDTIERLRNEINTHNYNYYVCNNPTISDKEFDDLLAELQRLEDENPQYFSPLSPTQRVGSDISEGFTQVEHKYPMLSLGNTYTIGEVEAFYNRVTQGLSEPFEIVAELKKYGTVTVDSGMCIVCVVGDMDWENLGFESRALDALSDIPVRMISYGGSNYNISFLIRESDKKAALQKLSDLLFNN